MNLKELINKYRNNRSKGIYSKLVEKLFYMHNNDESLGIFMKPDFKTCLTKTIDNEVYIPIFTEDANSIQTILDNEKEYVLVMMKISGLFDILLKQSNVEGFVLNDGDGKGNVLFPKIILVKTLEMQ